MLPVNVENKVIIPDAQHMQSPLLRQLRQGMQPQQFRKALADIRELGGAANFGRPWDCTTSGDAIGVRPLGPSGSPSPWV